MGIPASPGTRWFGTASAALLGCALSLLLSAAASAAPGWLAPTDLSERGRDASNAVVAADDAGDMAVVWERQSTTDPTAHIVQVSTRRAGEPFSAPLDLSFRSTEPKVAMTPGGETVVAWRHFQAPFTTVQISSRPPGGSFSSPATVYTAPEKAFPQQLRLALNAGGDVALAWSQVDPESGLDLLVCEKDPETEQETKCPNPRFVMASVRPAGGAFSPPARISPPRGTAPAEETEAEKEAREKQESRRTAAIGDVAIDAAGDVIGVWTYFDGSDRVAQAALRPAA
ncbi:MAG TPA: hypothetical protein VGF04_00280, partial [Solirubrobacterales bacterium]